VTARTPARPLFALLSSALLSSALLSSALLVASGCAVVSPPPMRMLEEPVLRPEPGAVSVAVSGGGGGGVFLKGFAGGEARVAMQGTREMALEASGGAGHVVEKQDVHGSPTTLVFGRVGGIYRPTRLDWITLRFGAGGGGANNGLTYATTDVGVGFGWTFLRRVRPYGGVSLALSTPVERGPLVGNDDDDRRRPGTNVWLGASAGVAVRLVDHLECGVEGMFDWGLPLSHGADGGLGVAATGVLRYTFGPTK
jgi:hypothetical protein